MEIANKSKVINICKVLPMLDCDWCGYITCERFTEAVINGNISPFGYRRDPWTGNKISDILNK